MIEAIKIRNDRTKSAESVIGELEDIQKDIATALKVTVADALKWYNDTKGGSYYTINLSSVEGIMYSGTLREYDIKLQVALFQIQSRLKLMNELNRVAFNKSRMNENAETFEQFFN